MISISLKSQWRDKPIPVAQTYPWTGSHTSGQYPSNSQWVSVARQTSQDAQFVWNYIETLTKQIDDLLKSRVDYAEEDLVVDEDGVEYKVLDIVKDWWEMNYKYPWDHKKGSPPYSIRIQETKGKKKVVRATSHFVKKVKANEQTS
jgi:hypothetical protein